MTGIAPAIQAETPATPKANRPHGQGKASAQLVAAPASTPSAIAARPSNRHGSCKYVSRGTVFQSAAEAGNTRPVNASAAAAKNSAVLRRACIRKIVNAPSPPNNHCGTPSRNFQPETGKFSRSVVEAGTKSSRAPTNWSAASGRDTSTKALWNWTALRSRMAGSHINAARHMPTRSATPNGQTVPHVGRWPTLLTAYAYNASHTNQATNN